MECIVKGEKKRTIREQELNLLLSIKTGCGM
jgi:hypothetical protein